MNVLLIENHPIMAKGIQHVFENHFEIINVDISKNGKQALEALNNNTYKVVVMDIVLPNTDSHTLLHHIKRLQNEAKILIFSNNQDEVYALPYITMGANGYLNKSQSEQDFVLAIRMILAGQLFLSQRVINKKMKINSYNNEPDTPFKKLSKRELELFNHLMKGKRMKDASTIMNIHQSTAATLKKRMMKKLGVNSLVDLINLAKEFGFK